jgi:hypothetical protein
MKDTPPNMSEGKKTTSVTDEAVAHSNRHHGRYDTMQRVACREALSPND